MFRKLCGDDTLKNVLIVTTMWSLVNHDVGEAREHELKTDERFFKPVLDKGATMVRHDNTRQTAHAILRRVLRNHPLPLDIQHEMVDQGKDISETAAAAEIDRQLTELVEKHRRELEQVKAELREAIDAKDEQAKQELLEVKEELEARLRQTEHDRQRLSEEYAAEKKRADEAYQQMTKDLEKQQAALESGAKQMDELRQQFHESNLQASKERLMLLERLSQERVVYVDRGPTCVVQ